eukprot:6893479-Pyramimonas_sp.AAC.1
MFGYNKLNKYSDKLSLSTTKSIILLHFTGPPVPITTRMHLTPQRITNIQQYTRAYNGIQRNDSHLLEVVPPLVGAVSLCDLDLKHLKLLDGRRQPGQTLPAAAAHADEQRVPPRLLDDAADAREVLDGEEEDDQMHGLFGHVVVVRQVLVHHLEELVHVAHLVVVAVPAGHQKVAEDEVAQLLARHLSGGGDE